MRVVDLDGHVYDWSLVGNSTNRISRSDPHLQCRAFLKERFPLAFILEEVAVYIHTKDIAFLDFYIPLYKTAIEVHGEQHYQYVPHFHGSKLNFFRALKKDKEKQEWCELNGIRYVALKHDEQDRWNI